MGEGKEQHTFVSGMTNHVNTPAIAANAAKKIYVPQPMRSNIFGVTSPMMKLHIHVLLVVRLMALLRVARLYISDGSTHPMGAQL